MKPTASCSFDTPSREGPQGIARTRICRPVPRFEKNPDSRQRGFNHLVLSLRVAGTYS